MYSRYDPTVHDTFLPVGREAKTYEFPSAQDAPPPDAHEEAEPQAAAVSAAQAAAAPSAPPRGGLLDGLRGLFGGLGQGRAGELDIGDIILLLIVALLFLEDGNESDLIILLAVALFIGF